MKPPTERHIAMAARRADGATLRAVAAEYATTETIVRNAARHVERFDRGMVMLRLDPQSIEALELIGQLRGSTRSSLEARGFKRVGDLVGMPLDQLLRLPNIGRDSAEMLMRLVAEIER